VVVQREILELISGLCKEFNTALIFITHDLSLLLELADKIAIMYAGNMIEKATSRDIYLHPRHPYSYGLLNSFPTLHGPRHRMAGIPGSPPDLRTLPTGCTFAPRCPLAFSTCSTVVPELLPLDEAGKLLPATAGQTGQQAACHLYDPRFHAEPPSTADLAAKYEALAAEGSNVQ
jgi:peptide/nickel transport system ATP-binding protein